MYGTYVRVKMDDISKIQLNEKNVILRKNVFMSEDLIQQNNPLWGYYPVKTFIINEEEINAHQYFPYHYVLCGDSFGGECYLIFREK
jgi:hypothetical protein